VKRDRVVRRLASFLGILFLLFGIAEVIRVVGWGGSGLAFWLLSLCGGGALILIGTFGVQGRPWLSCTLVAVGCLAAAVATMWTLILPILALTLLVLTLLRSGEAATPPSA
jgi:hypothetical protein